MILSAQISLHDSNKINPSIKSSADNIESRVIEFLLVKKNAFFVSGGKNYFQDHPKTAEDSNLTRILATSSDDGLKPFEEAFFC